MTSNLTAKLIASISEVAPAAWNSLTGNRYPFLRHEFLSALENNDCLGNKTGWIPQHLVFLNDLEELVAAVPMYQKHNSFGEFVFDWSWANAYERAGLQYYPKLVIASPFTPATGPKVLMLPRYACAELFQNIIDKTIDYSEQLGFSSVHWLFPTAEEAQNAPNLLVRAGCQFHWQNDNYRCFDDFLSRMNSQKRKQIKRERRRTHEAGVLIRRVKGDQLDQNEWRIFHELYLSTFSKHGNYPALTQAFFTEIGETMGDQILVVFAQTESKIIAASFFLVGADALYGRYWGCFENIPGLHFEACYYQGLEFCIENGLKRFEPGAQGEHKISRGFLPTKTRSLHWIHHPDFRRAIAKFLIEENLYVDQYLDSLMLHSPFKSSPN